MSYLLPLWLITLTYCKPVSQDIFEPLNNDFYQVDFSDNTSQHIILPSVTLLANKFIAFRNITSGEEKIISSIEKTFVNRFLHFFSRIPEVSRELENEDPSEILSRYGDQSDESEASGDKLSPGYYEHHQECHTRTGLYDEPLLLISRCPAVYPDNTIRRLCEDIPSTQSDNTVSLSSLSVADEDGNVFANQFCAKCHNVTYFDSWQFSCVFDVTDFGRIREDDYSICNLNALPPFFLDNMSCAVPFSPKTSHLNERMGRKRYDSEESNIKNFPVSFSILMNFGFDGKAHILFTEAHHIVETPAEISCPKNQIFDPDKRKCRPVVCEKGYILKDQKCVKDSPTLPTSKPLDIDDVKADDIAQVSLEVNVPYKDHFLLFSESFPRMMVAEIGSLFNISESRIRNFTIQPLQGKGSGNILEIHRYKHNSEPKVSRSRTGSNIHLKRTRTRTGLPDNSKWISFNITNHASVRDFMVDHISFVKTVLYILKIPSHKPADKTPQNVFSETTEPLPIRNTATSSGSQPVVDITHPESKMPGEETMETQHPRESVVVKISFLLMPPSKESGQEGKSVVAAVEEMTHMVDKKSFQVNVNNTRLSVVGIVNEGEPLSLTTWCKKGVFNSYDDTKFRVGTVCDPSTQQNITFVYIDETSEVYGPGEYDLVVLVEGSFFDRRNPNVSGYAIVCTKPRLVDKSCPTILLQQDEFEILDHDKVLIDIYTKRERSIFEYRWVGNESVEICMPDLADKTCGRIKLCESEYVILDNKSIIYSGDMYNIFQYQRSGNGTVEICIPGNYFDELADGNITDRVTGCDLVDYKGWLTAEVYLTATLSMISILSMAIVLMTYCIFPKLRNLPGTNTMNLTLALIIAEMVFEFGSSSTNKTACVIVGVTLHFFFLASFFWMNVMAYDVYRTFANSCLLTRVRSKSKYFLRYSVYGWGSPAIIVIVCCFIDFSCFIKNVHIGYGPRREFDDPVDVNSFMQSSNHSQSLYPEYSRHHQRLGCWIQEPLAALASFGGPILIILFANAVFYVKAIICIHATTRSSLKNTRRSSQRRLTGQNDVIIYVRMSTVMGFTWIIGFTSSFISSVASDGGNVVCLVLRILTILFTLFNCSQGFLIFFVFVFNRRVGKLYKQLVWKKWLSWKKYIKRRHTGSFPPNKRMVTISS